MRYFWSTLIEWEMLGQLGSIFFFFRGLLPNHFSDEFAFGALLFDQYCAVSVLFFQGRIPSKRGKVFGEVIFVWSTHTSLKIHCECPLVRLLHIDWRLCVGAVGVSKRIYIFLDAVLSGRGVSLLGVIIVVLITVLDNGKIKKPLFCLLVGNFLDCGRVL